MREAKHVYDRHEYGILEMLSEIGGLFGIFKVIAFVLVYAFLSEPRLFVISGLIKQRMHSVKDKK